MTRTIVWSHRGFVIQWMTSDGSADFTSGPMKGVDDDFPMRGGLPLGLWHSALTDAMHWAYEPSQTPPAGWRDATSEELELCVEEEDDES